MVVSRRFFLSLTIDWQWCRRLAGATSGRWLAEPNRSRPRPDIRHRWSMRERVRESLSHIELPYTKKRPQFRKHLQKRRTKTRGPHRIYAFKETEEGGGWRQRQPRANAASTWPSTEDRSCRAGISRKARLSAVRRAEKAPSTGYSYSHWTYGVLRERWSGPKGAIRSWRARAAEMKESLTSTAATRKTRCVRLRQVWRGCEIEGCILDAETAFTLNRFPKHRPSRDRSF